MRRKLHSDLVQEIIFQTIEVSGYKELDYQEKVLLACGKICMSEESKYIEDFETFNAVIAEVKKHLTFWNFLDKTGKDKNEENN